MLANFVVNSWEGALTRARAAKIKEPLHTFFDAVFGVVLRRPHPQIAHPKPRWSHVRLLCSPVVKEGRKTASRTVVVGTPRAIAGSIFCRGC